MASRFVVTPFVGVWIETILFCTFSIALEVTPFVGVWIETFNSNDNIQKPNVTPFVGVWIETATALQKYKEIQSHTLRGCVD